METNRIQTQPMHVTMKIDDKNSFGIETVVLQ